MKASNRHIHGAGNCCGREATRGRFLVVGNQPHPGIAARQNFFDIAKWQVFRKLNAESLAMAAHGSDAHTNAIDRVSADPSP